MAKRRAGLHKHISSIFDGVPIPKAKDGQQLAYAPTPERTADEPLPEPKAEPFVTIVPEEPLGPSPKISPTPELQPDEQQVHPLPTAYEPAKAKPSSQPAYSQPQPRLDEEKWPASAKPEPQGQTEPVPPLPEVSARKKPKTAVTIKALRPAKRPLQQGLQQMKQKLFAPKAGLSNTRQKAMVVLVPALAIVLIFVLTQVISSPSRSLAKAQQKEPARSEQTAASAGEIDWKVPAPYPATIRDPMQMGPLVTAQSGPQESETAQTEQLIVRSILHSDSKPSAVIGTQIVHEGDVILGATIIKIDKDGVEFEKEGKTWTQKVERP